MKILKRFINFINKSNVRRKAVYALILSVLFISVTVFGAVTYARFYTSYNEAWQAQVAKYAFNFENVSLKRKANGQTEGQFIAIDKKANACEIHDIQPEDVIDYVFLFQDKDDDKTNEVRLRVTLNITVSLETMEIIENADGSVETKKSAVYFSALGHPADATTESDLRRGADMKLVKISGGQETDIPVDESRDTVDYSCSELYVHKTGENPADLVENKIGFYMEPYSGDVTIHRFKLQFTLPEQIHDATSYAGARLLINVHADVEQVQANTEVSA